MKKAFLLIAGLASVFIAAQVQNFKVANFAYGAYGKPSYESLSFYEKNGSPAEIRYSYGNNPNEIKLQNLGPATYKGKRLSG